MAWHVFKCPKLHIQEPGKWPKMGLLWASSVVVQCHKPSFIILQALCLSNLIPWIYLSLPLYNCRSPTPATRDSTWRGERCRQWDSLSFFYGLPVYFKFKILFNAFTKTLGQRFDIFSSPSPRFIISINHCCSSSRVPASGILSGSALSSIIYLL